jgi:hypothetical protein
MKVLTIWSRKPGETANNQLVLVRDAGQLAVDAQDLLADPRWSGCQTWQTSYAGASAHAESCFSRNEKFPLWSSQFRAATLTTILLNIYSASGQSSFS